MITYFLFFFTILSFACVFDKNGLFNIFLSGFDELYHFESLFYFNHYIFGVLKLAILTNEKVYLINHWL